MLPITAVDCTPSPLSDWCHSLVPFSLLASFLVFSQSFLFPFRLFLFLQVPAGLLARLIAPRYAILSAGSSHVLESKLNHFFMRVSVFPAHFSWQMMPASNLYQESEHHPVVSPFDLFFSMPYPGAIGLKEQNLTLYGLYKGHIWKIMAEKHRHPQEWWNGVV